MLENKLSKFTTRVTKNWFQRTFAATLFEHFWTSRLQAKSFVSTFWTFIAPAWASAQYLERRQRVHVPSNSVTIQISGICFETLEGEPIATWRKRQHAHSRETEQQTTPHKRQQRVYRTRDSESTSQEWRQHQYHKFHTAKSGPIWH